MAFFLYLKLKLKVMFKHKVACITGGTKGIGLGIAKILSDQGIRVAISGRKREDVDKAISVISSDPSKVLGIVSDVKHYQHRRKTQLRK